MSEFVELDKVIDILTDELSLAESLKRLMKLPRFEPLEDYNVVHIKENIDWKDNKQLLEACRKSNTLDPRWWRKDLR